MALVALVVPLMTAGVTMAPDSQRLPADVLAQAPNGAGQEAGGEETVVGVSEKHDVSPPLRLIQHPPAERRPEREDIPLRPVPRGGQKLGQRDPALQPGPVTVTSSAPAPGLGFDGASIQDDSTLAGGLVAPPDPNGDVGKTHYVQAVNLLISVYDKVTGTRVLQERGNALFLGFGGVCETTNRGDPVVLYDATAGRWMYSQFAFTTNVFGQPRGPYYQCVAVSTAEDPTGTWNRYAFKMSDKKFNDYPKFGIWPDPVNNGYYLSFNQFTSSVFGFSYSGQGVVVFERNKMIAGQPARFVYKDLSSNSALGGMLPSHLNGASLPPPNSPNYYLQIASNNILRMYKFSVNWTPSTPTSSFTSVGDFPVTIFDTNFSAGVPQPPPTTNRLDLLNDRLMYRLNYRNLGDHEALVVNHTVDATGQDQAGIRWYELRKTGAGPWSVYQQSTYAGDIPDTTTHRWMGSINMDKAGNIALGYSASGSPLNPSIRYTGRQAGDPINILHGETTLAAGVGSQNNPTRWGDYSSMSVDPVDDCTFWYTQEYYATPGPTDWNWQTRIGSFKFPGCP